LFGSYGALFRFASAGRLLVAIHRQHGTFADRGRGGYIALRWSGRLTDVFIALAIALAAFA